MTALALAKMAYASGTGTLSTPRGTEYDAFSRVTHRMSIAARHGRRGFVHLAHAIHENRRLWTTLAASASDADNKLPAAVRAQVFYLAKFTETHSRAVLKGQADIGPLVDINTAIMRGLNEGARP